jgi:CheY-like chemotaxis protein
MQRLLCLFRAAGHAPLLASSPRDALPLFVSDHFDVVVTDDGDAAMSAEELALWLRERLPAGAPPVVRMTSEEVEPSRLFAAVVSRPVDPLDLLYAVERALAARADHGLSGSRASCGSGRGRAPLLPQPSSGAAR